MMTTARTRTTPWFTASSSAGLASGIWTWRSRWPLVAPSERAHSIAAGSTPRRPWVVMRTAACGADGDAEAEDERDGDGGEDLAERVHRQVPDTEHTDGGHGQHGGGSGAPGADGPGEGGDDQEYGPPGQPLQSVAERVEDPVGEVRGPVGGSADDGDAGVEVIDHPVLGRVDGLGDGDDSALGPDPAAREAAHDGDGRGDQRGEPPAARSAQGGGAGGLGADPAAGRLGRP